ncbi:putative ATPase, OSCP/delta subunit, F1F0 ATP synthase OSCP/delta subunit domain superfamily [Arabidopsis thaliana]|uniref:F1F0 ATP synthase OSCP/delta subunit N-terminal domain superfamily n=1 Tax=Arabidopsis thaliana x Arabidopsis arenosa TaxID=1240361 RepID=A0A8T2DVZ5_9BRAS|nr:F1F0 ATP synthase OSCP/delta subunit N-terminal domain superfamily [Arabidopsis thaliana x Arabidopsis arenosa]
MDTLSASVSSLNLPSLPPPPQPPLRSISSRFKSTVNATTSASSTNLSKPTSSSPSSASYSQNRNPNFLKAISFQLPQTKPSRVTPPPVHDKAASGFAAALVSVCQSKNCLGRTQEDVRRLMEFLVGEEKKRNKVLVNDVVERGKFGKHLKGLVKMLITRGKSGILVDVLMEFERICNELVSTKLVWVS